MHTRVCLTHMEGGGRYSNPNPGFNVTKWNVMVPNLTTDKIATLGNKIIKEWGQNERKRENTSRKNTVELRIKAVITKNAIEMRRVPS